MPNTTISLSDFYCVECGKKGIPIVRKQGSERESGHLKKLFCLNCKTETNHAEIRPFSNYTYEDFLEEFNMGRFKDGKRIPINDLVLCSKSICKYNKNGRCWNANNSYNCQHKNQEEVDANE